MCNLNRKILPAFCQEVHALITEGFNAGESFQLVMGSLLSVKIGTQFHDKEQSQGKVIEW